MRARQHAGVGARVERGKPLSALVCVLRNASVQQGARGARTEKKFWRPRVGVASIERAMSLDFRVVEISGKLPFETRGRLQGCIDLLSPPFDLAICCLVRLPSCLKTRSQPGHRHIQTITAALRGVTAPCLARIHSMLLCFFTSARATALLPPA